MYIAFVLPLPQWFTSDYLYTHFIYFTFRYPNHGLFSLFYNTTDNT